MSASYTVNLVAGFLGIVITLFLNRFKYFVQTKVDFFSSDISTSKKIKMTYILIGALIIFAFFLIHNRFKRKINSLSPLIQPRTTFKSNQRII